MTTWWFPDNTVLCNFAVVDGIHVLGQILDSRGRWTTQVEHEARMSARHIGNLRKLIDAGYLGEPIAMTDEAEIRTIDAVRRAVFGGAENRPSQHLGEAQTCHVIEKWPEFKGSAWITDDREAFDFAVRRGITAMQTMDLVCHGVADGVVTADGGFHLLHAMVKAGRVLHRIPRRPDDLRR